MRQFFQMILAVLIAFCSVQPLPAAGQSVANPTLQVDTFPSHDQEVVWLAYGLALANYVDEHKLVDTLPEGAWKPNFEAEVFARGKQARIWEELNQKQKLSYDFMDQMERIVKAGFLREYVWQYYQQPEWTKPEGLKFVEFSNWAKTNLTGHHPMSGARIFIKR